MGRPESIFHVESTTLALTMATPEVMLRGRRALRVPAHAIYRILVMPVADRGDSLSPPERNVSPTIEQAKIVSTTCVVDVRIHARAGFRGIVTGGTKGLAGGGGGGGQTVVV